MRKTDQSPVVPAAEAAALRIGSSMRADCATPFPRGLCRCHGARVTGGHAAGVHYRTGAGAEGRIRGDGSQPGDNAAAGAAARHPAGPRIPAETPRGRVRLPQRRVSHEPGNRWPGADVEQPGPRAGCRRTLRTAVPGPRRGGQRRWTGPRRRARSTCSAPTSRSAAPIPAGRPGPTRPSCNS
jgi:hypothetical protein